MEMSQVLGLDAELSDDDLDRLFSELLQREPPPELVEQILNSVRQLPLPQFIQSPQELEVTTWDWETEADAVSEEEQGLLVHHEHLQPS
jgi:hypothetical protein